MKRCKHCGETKPHDEFYTDRGARDGHRPECKECNRASRRVSYQASRDTVIARVVAWQRANRDRYNERQREYRRKNPDSDWPGYLRRTFGLTVEQYQAFAEAHDCRCAICGVEAPDGKRHHLDHDHAADFIRGLLCVRCNNGLGQFLERPELLQRAADYLESGGFIPSGVVDDQRLARERALALRRRAA